MTPRERILAAFEGRPYDRVPVFHAGFSSAVASALLGRPEAHVGGGICQWREATALWNGPAAHAEFVERSFQDAVALTALLDQDLVREAYWRKPTRPTAKIDDQTFVYGDPAGAHEVWRFDPATELYDVVHRVPPPAPLTAAAIARQVEATEASAERYQPGANQFATVLRARDHFAGQRAVRAGGVGININYREPAWLEAVALYPELVGRLLAAQATIAVKNVDAAADAGIRILAGGGDFASNQGPFVSPASYRALWTPAVQRVTAQCHTRGVFHKYASDGNLWPVAADLFPHLDGYYELDELAGMDLARLRQQYPHLVLFGGVNSQTLHQGSPAQVVAEVERAMAAAQRYGGVVVGCSNQLVKGTPLANVTAMTNAIERLRDG
ncbi:MAG: hypothetical protein IT204_15755 [Fimbriimonadaceae bacterium]|nr:hypothetical protein [Fimbriimonadaceae bacterium]